MVEERDVQATHENDQSIYVKDKNLYVKDQDLFVEGMNLEDSGPERGNDAEARWPATTVNR